MIWLLGILLAFFVLSAFASVIMFGMAIDRDELE